MIEKNWTFEVSEFPVGRAVPAIIHGAMKRRAQPALRLHLAIVQKMIYFVAPFTMSVIEKNQSFGIPELPGRAYARHDSCTMKFFRV